MGKQILFRGAPTVRIALISDVHTNLAAWDALMDHLRNVASDQVWSLGDWLGYYDYFPLRLWDRLRTNSSPAMRHLYTTPGYSAVIGNHDLGVLNVPDSGLFNGAADAAIQRQRRELQHAREWRTPGGKDGEFASWLRRQPYMLSPLPGVYLAHGVFYPDQPALMPQWYPGRDITHEQSFQRLLRWLRNGPVAATADNEDQNSQLLVAANGWREPLILITGHTHHQGVWQRPNSPSLDQDWPMADGAVVPRQEIIECAQNCRVLEHKVQVWLSVERPVWINPGSVGDPRDLATPQPRCASGTWRWARYAVLEWEVAQPTQALVYLYWLPYQTNTA